MIKEPKGKKKKQLQQKKAGVNRLVSNSYHPILGTLLTLSPVPGIIILGTLDLSGRLDKAVFP